MREILFRAKRLGTEKWIHGYLFRCWERAYIAWGMSNDVADIKEVAPETVCQYTGLTDKNGRKNFEGDILSAHLDNQYPEDITYVQTTWDGFSWCTRESTEDDVMTEHDCNVFEVCGNIFDNPELIGGKECT